MAGGLIALLDDVAALAKLAAASVDDVSAAAGRAGAKAAGVVVDDTAVTPRYVTGFHPERELPIIRRIATGSLRNKVLFILPAALVLSEFLPWLLTPLLMIGGAYLCFEGAEKVYEAFGGAREHTRGDHEAMPLAVADDTREHEERMVRSAVRTDFILSAEIMVIALNEVADQGLVARAVILVAVAVLITALVYGAVALIVKMDDVGLHLARGDAPAATIGRGLVTGMPRLLAALAAVGTVAMLWVGGHILLDGIHELGWHVPYDLVHDLAHDVGAAAGPASGVAEWTVATALSSIVGLAVGAVAMLVVRPFHRTTH